VRRELGRAVVRLDRSDHVRELQRHGLTPDVQASHPKIGALVREAADVPRAFSGKESRLTYDAAGPRCSRRRG